MEREQIFGRFGMGQQAHDIRKNKKKNIKWDIFFRENFMGISRCAFILH
jgi:hypothetical protein